MKGNVFSLEVSNGQELELLGYISNLNFSSKKEKRAEHKNKSQYPYIVDRIDLTVNIDANFIFEEIVDNSVWETIQPKTYSISGGYEVVINDRNGKNLFVENGIKSKVRGIFSSNSLMPNSPKDSFNWIGNNMTLKLTYSYTVFP